MDQAPAQQPTTPPAPTPTPAPVTSQAPAKPRPGYLKRLFAGRLNRQNYIVGSTFFALVPLICFFVVLFNILVSPDTFAQPYLDPNNPTQIVMPQEVSVFSLFLAPGNKYWTIAGTVLFVLSIPYLFSLQIRRLHDLGLSGWLWIINFVPMISLLAFMPDINIFSPPLWLNIVNIISLIFSLFPFYVSLWPGTSTANNYGAPPLPRSSFLGDILAVKP